MPVFFTSYVNLVETLTKGWLIWLLLIALDQCKLLKVIHKFHVNCKKSRASKIVDSESIYDCFAVSAQNQSSV